MEHKTQQNAFLLFSSPWQRIPFFSALPVPMIHSLLENSELKQLKNKQTLFQQGDSAEAFGFVVDGCVRLVRLNPRGQRVVMDFVGPGGMIAGLLMSQTQIQYPVTSQAVGPTQFLQIPKSTFEKHWLCNAEAMRRTQNANIERMQAIQSVRELQKYPLEEKLAQVLLRLGAGPEARVDIKVSKTDLADMVGACVESVIRIFSAWEKKGWLQSSPGKYDSIAKDKLLETQSL